MSYKILVINPGSTSTKIGVYEDETLLFEETLRHSTEEIAKYATIVDQKDFRKELIVDILAKNSFDIKSLNVVVGRGGLLKPIPGGTYPVSDALLADLKQVCKDSMHRTLEASLPAKSVMRSEFLLTLLTRLLSMRWNLLQDIPESRNFRVSVSSTH